MQISDDSIYRRPEGWKTAGILQRSDAKQFMGRLSSGGIDFIVSAEESQLRVSVAADDLPRAMELRPDIAASAADYSPGRQGYLKYVIQLFTIPVSFLVGRILCNLFSIESKAIPCCLAIASLLFVGFFQPTAPKTLKHSKHRK